jgi:hypothetical protein
MIPGLTTKLSEVNVAAAASFDAKADILRVTDTATTTVVTTIVPRTGGFSQVIFLQNKSGASMTVVTTGNVSGTGTITLLNQRMMILVFSKVEGKWSMCNDT